MSEVLRSILITGNSSGLGYGLTGQYLEQGWRVYGCSRRGCHGLAGDLRDVRCDLADFEQVPGALQSLLGDAAGLDLVVLNAGILGTIQPLSATSMNELRHIMDINVWANKAVMDWLLAWGRPVRQVIMISSGAAVLGNKGWGGYALSKAALNMLARLYAHEFPDSHVSALAPGLVDTAMMDYLCVKPDPEEYPALQRIRDARDSGAMPGPPAAARKVASVVDRLREFPSGGFIDIRQIFAPEEYARLMHGAVSR
jgi:benzil reductase ((S)-benzoin forming)